MTRWNKDSLRDRFAAGEPPGAVAAEPTRRAAVAVVLRLGAAPAVLLMKRALREDDPWSGQVSFPGGRFQPGDRDLRHTAMRETREELGIDLAVTACAVGALASIAATGRSTGRPLPATTVTPFVFVENTAVEPVAGPEAEVAFWLPIETAAAGRFDGELEYVHHGTPMTFPCWRFDGFVIWGLTYRMLRSLIDAVEATAGP